MYFIVDVLIGYSQNITCLCISYILNVLNNNREI